MELTPEEHEPLNFSLTIAGYSLLGADLVHTKAMAEIKSGMRQGIVLCDYDNSAVSYEVWD